MNFSGDWFFSKDSKFDLSDLSEYLVEQNCNQDCVEVQSQNSRFFPLIVSIFNIPKEESHQLDMTYHFQKLFGGAVFTVVTFDFKGLKEVDMFFVDKFGNGHLARESQVLLSETNFIFDGLFEEDIVDSFKAIQTIRDYQKFLKIKDDFLDD